MLHAKSHLVKILDCCFALKLVKADDPVKLLADKKYGIALTKDLKLYSSAKCMEIIYHFITYQTEKSEKIVSYIPSFELLANPFTIVKDFFFLGGKK